MTFREFRDLLEALSKGAVIIICTWSVIRGCLLVHEGAISVLLRDIKFFFRYEKVAISEMKAFFRVLRDLWGNEGWYFFEYHEQLGWFPFLSERSMLIFSVFLITGMSYQAIHGIGRYFAILIIILVSYDLYFYFGWEGFICTYAMVFVLVVTLLENENK
jgi:hypothetical protein